MKMHIEEKPHKCTRCEHVFTHVTAFEKHMMLHKEQNQETQTVSDQFSNEARNLDTYQKCPDCTQVFVNVAYLESHMKSCIKEKR